MQNYALIIDPLSSGALYAEELTNRNITPLAVLSHYPIFPDMASSFKEDDFAHVFIYANDLEKLVDEIHQFISSNLIKLCLPGSEPGVPLADDLARIFCSSKMNDPALTLARYNKYAMAKQLAKTNIRLPLTHCVDTVEAAIEWAEKNQFIDSGIVTKPLNSGGTDGVSLCFNTAEIETGINAILGKCNQFGRVNEKVLVQEFLAGEEYVVDTVSCAGKHQISNVCKYKKIAANGSAFVYDYLDFLSENDEKIPLLSDYICPVLDGLGVQNGPAHTEIMMTQKGARLIEVGSRLHGGVAIHAARLATGTSQLDLSLDYLLGNTEFSEDYFFKLNKHVRIVFLISPVSGVISDITHKLLFIEQLPSFNLMRSELEEGKALHKTIDMATMPGLIILCHEDKNQIETDYLAIRTLEQELYS